jgi:hypothetical protein
MQNVDKIVELFRKHSGDLSNRSDEGEASRDDGVAGAPHCRPERHKWSLSSEFAKFLQNGSESLDLSLHHFQRLFVAAGLQFENLDAERERCQGATELVIQVVFVDVHGTILAIGRAEPMSRESNAKAVPPGLWLFEQVMIHDALEADNLLLYLTDRVRIGPL